MALQNAPAAIDLQEIQFKLHAKCVVFSESKESKSLVSLLAVSSSKGLLFAGNPNVKELKVIKIKDVESKTSSSGDLHVRVVSLPGEPSSIACSCDGSMLAVNYILNNTGFLQIYQVDSFVTPNITTLYNVPVSPESCIFALQLLWNPVIANNICLILNDGSVTMFSLNPGGQYDKVTLGKEHQVKSGCWSPKGKQIVFGFAEGKLQQFKPNLQPARAIPCPPGIYSSPFDCIAVHWLSTFQFAAVFLQRGQEMCPSLFIVNAPKAGNPSYINYYDICYSAPGPRTQQLTFNHIAQWNLLLVSSANGVEVGILGTKETGESPTWVQYTLLDEARIEMPLTELKDETYPMGFAFDTASSHQVKVGEQFLPVMPMIHVLSTHGHLVSFNFLNLSPNAVDVCSPPPPLSDVSGQFRPLRETIKSAAALGVQKPIQHMTAGTVIAPPGPPPYSGDTTFTLGSNMVTSTPAIKDKPVPMFGSLATGAPNSGSSDFGFGGTAVSAPQSLVTSATAKPSTGFSFGGTAGGNPPPQAVRSAAPAGFGAQTMTPSFGGFAAGGQNFGGSKPVEKQPPPTSAPAPAPVVQKNTDVNKPLYTVQPTFKPPPVVHPTVKTSSVQKVNMNTGEIDEVVKQMIAIQIDAFETEMKQIRMHARKLIENIGTPNEIKSYTKHLNDLQEIIEQAGDHEFEQDVQSLRHSMNDSYAILAECRTKLDLFNNPNITRLSTISSSDPTSRRQLAKLQAYMATNQTQLSQVNHLIDSQWSQYQDIVRRNTKNQMHIPCLDGIYQRMSKLKDLLARQRNKMNHIKGKLKQKGLNYKPSNEDVTSIAVGALTKNQSTMESLADSILSMSLSQVVSQTHAKLSEDKLNAIRNFTKQQQQITIIKPKRPDRIGLKSEVIMETKLETERKQREMARQKTQQQLPQKQQTQQMPELKPVSTMPSIQKPMQQYPMPTQQMSSTKPSQPLNIQQMQQQQTYLAKPTASKPPLLTTSNQPAAFITPSPATSSALSFGGQSSFVKTSTASGTKLDDSSRPLAASTPFPAFGGNSSGLGFGQPKAVSQAAEMKENLPTNTPISFAAKVIGGNDAKSFANLSNKTNLSGPFTSTSDTNASNQGFAAFSSNKPPPVLTDTTPKDGKKSEEVGKTFSFGGGISATLTSSANPTSSAASATTTPAFGGFGDLAKPVATAATSVVSSSSGGVFTSSMFGSGLPSAKPFALSVSSSAPFAPTSTFSFNTTATSLSSATTTTSVAIKSADPTPSPVATVPAKQLEIVSPSSESVASSSANNTASFSFGGIALSSSTTTAPSTISKSAGAPNVTITSSGIQAETKPAPAVPAVPKLPTTSTDPTDSLFGSLNICKPDVKETSESSQKTANFFSGFGAAAGSTTSVTPFGSGGGAGEGAKTLLGSTAATTTTTGFSFGSVTSATGNIFGKQATSTETTAAVTTVNLSTTPASSTAPAAASTTFSFGTSTTAGSATASTFGGPPPVSSTSATGTSTSTTTSTTSGSGFGVTGSSIFTQVAPSSAVATTGTTSMFGGAAAAVSSGPPLFASTAPATAAAATLSTASIFGGTATTPAPPTGGGLFGGIPKPDQSVFGTSNAAASPATGLFAAAAASTKPPATPSGGSIFGGGAMSTGFGAPAAGATGGSIFGGGSAAATAPTTSPFGSTAPTNTAGSVFGGGAGAAKPAEGGNIFGSPTQQSASSGGSIFGKSSFGQPTAVPQSAGSIFGGSAAQSPSTGGFGATGGGSIFGGGGVSNNPASGGSIFGGAAPTTAPAFGSSTASPGFGSFSQPTNAPAFGSPSGGFGGAAGGGFGSPQQQSPFAKPVFGGPATFGSPPAFGAQPTFGGAPTFGSPKGGFGSFAATSPTGGGGFGAPAPAPIQGPKGNIFETLGATDSGLSFGNLAQTTQPPPQQKPSFGGSSFMNYR